jgi:hypothetical protein
MGGLGDVTFADIARALGRYRPVAFTVLAILLLLAILPNHHRPSVDTAAAAAVRSTGGGALRPAAAAPAAGTEVAGASTDSAALGSTSAVSSTGTIGSSPSYSSSFGGSSTSGGSSSSSSSYTYSPPSAGSTSDGFDTTSSDSSAAGDDTPLTIAAATWATGQGAGTPVGSAQVPDGDLPVGKRLTSDDKRSFLRLRGGQRILTLHADPSGARAPINGTADVEACQVTEGGWKEQPGSSFADAPAYDPAQCVAGKPSADGTTWTFDLSSFARPTDDRGIALVPAKTAAADFQVAFTR